MTTTEIVNEIKNLIIKALKLKETPESISAESDLAGSLGLDSVDTLTLITSIEEKFNVMIDDEDIKTLNTVNNIAAYIENMQ